LHVGTPPYFNERTYAEGVWQYCEIDGMWQVLGEEKYLQHFGWKI
jgi:hypothetical protein